MSARETTWVRIWDNRALGDKFLKFGMMLDMGMRVSKTIANKMTLTYFDLFAQNPIWLPHEIRDGQILVVVITRT